MTRYRPASVECRTGRSAKTETEMDRMRAAAWHQQGVLTVNPETQDGLSWPDRELLIRIGERLFGKRSEA